MMKKLIFTIMVIGISSNVLALPIVHKIGPSAPVSVIKSNIDTKSADVTKSRSGKLFTGKLTPISSINTSSSNEGDTLSLSGRMPTIHKIGNLNTQSIKKTTSTTTAPSASANDLEELTERVETLEDTVSDLPSDVVVKTNGYYVTDVDKEDTTITVTKTDTVLVPVKKLSGALDTGKAEIWVVR